jgi:hypothetical protein
MISRDYVSQMLDYDRETGIFTWKSSPQGRIKAGSIAGSMHHPRLYIDIRINRKNYKAHRLAWLLEYGEWPSQDIDHINGDRRDNRIENLRLCTNTQNQANARLRKNNKIGLKGVHRYYNRYIAKCNGLYLGTFATKEEAHAAYVAASQSIFGEFARIV